MGLNRFFLELSYLGSNYVGWQVQPNGVSVQELIEKALGVLLKQRVSLVGAGRTDSEVHAISYVAHFDVNMSYDELISLSLVYKLNRILPKDISILGVREVRLDVHARFSAISRSYKYYICTRKDPFWNERAWLMEQSLDVSKMNIASQILMEYDDFQSFSKVNTQVNTFICKLFEARWTYEDHLLIFHIRSNRFLRNMVRALVGTLVDVGLGKTNIDDLRQIIESKNRSRAGYSAPGYGLYFLKAEYEDDIFIR